MTKKEELENQKSELISDLLATQTVMEEMWRYHPENPATPECCERNGTNYCESRPFSSWHISSS